MVKYTLSKAIQKKTSYTDKILLYNAYQKLTNARLMAREMRKLRPLFDSSYISCSMASYYSTMTDTLKRDIREYKGRLKTSDIQFRHSLSREIKGYGKISADAYRDSSILSTEELKNLRTDLINQIKDLRSERKLRTVVRRPYGEHTPVERSEYGSTVNLELGCVLKAFKNKVNKQCFRDKKPINQENHIGIEIECSLPNPDDNGWNKLAEKLLNENLVKYVQIKADGSIHSPEGYIDTELAIVAPVNQYAGVLGKVCTILSNMGAKVNKSCGLHIHLDARNRDPSVMLSRLVKAQQLLFKIVPVSRRNNTYCKKTSATTSLHSRSNRYRAVNGPDAFRKHRTIEVRLHSGTCDFDKINNWIMLLHTIINTELTLQPRSVKGWIRELALSEDLATYIVARFEKFKDVNESDETIIPVLESHGDDDNDSDYDDDSNTCEDCDERHSQVIYRDNCGMYLCECCNDDRVNESNANRG